MYDSHPSPFKVLENLKYRCTTTRFYQIACKTDTKSKNSNASNGRAMLLSMWEICNNESN